MQSEGISNKKTLLKQLDTYTRESKLFIAALDLRVYLLGIPATFADGSPFDIKISINSERISVEEKGPCLRACISLLPRYDTFGFHVEKSVSEKAFAQIRVRAYQKEIFPTYIYIQTYIIARYYFLHYKNQFFAAKCGKSKKKHAEKSALLWGNTFLRHTDRYGFQEDDILSILCSFIDETEPNEELKTQFLALLDLMKKRLKGEDLDETRYN